jgi:hypothetical protein
MESGGKRGGRLNRTGSNLSQLSEADVLPDVRSHEAHEDGAPASAAFAALHTNDAYDAGDAGNGVPSSRELDSSANEPPVDGAAGRSGGVGSEDLDVLGLSAEEEHMHEGEESGEMTDMVSVPVPGHADWSGAIDSPTNRLADLTLSEPTGVDACAATGGHAAASGSEKGTTSGKNVSAMDTTGHEADTPRRSRATPEDAGTGVSQIFDVRHAEGGDAAQTEAEVAGDNLQESAISFHVEEDNKDVCVS